VISDHINLSDLVLPDYVYSAFCLYEFEAAQHHLIVVKRCSHLIVLMMLDDSPNDADLNELVEASSALSNYIRQRTYIDCRNDEEWFKKLLYVLPDKGMLSPNYDDDGVLLAA
jgi:hypothetical protein